MLDQNKHEGGVDVGEIEAESRNGEDYGGEEEKEAGVDAEGRSLRRRLRLLMNLNLPGLRKRCR